MKIDLGMLGAHRLQIFGPKTRRDFIASVSIRQPQVVSTFMEDFRDFMKSRVPEYRREFDWNDKRRDPNRKYVVDCHVNSMKRPLLVFAVSSDDKGKRCHNQSVEF